MDSGSAHRRPPQPTGDARQHAAGDPGTIATEPPQRRTEGDSPGNSVQNIKQSWTRSVCHVLVLKKYDKSRKTLDCCHVLVYTLSIDTRT